jgi:RHS repeat-associated protein
MSIIHSGYEAGFMTYQTETVTFIMERKEYDYGARFYDPVIGRFGTIDRFAEKYSSMTPYQYAALDPIKNIDINGDSVWVSHSKGFLGLGGKEHLRYDNVTFTIRTVQLIAAR